MALRTTESKDIIYLFGSFCWGWLFRRPEYIATVLSKKGYRILFVESPFNFDFKNINFKNIFSKTNRMIIAERLRKGRILKIKENLWVYKTPFILPKTKFSIIRKINVMFIKRTIKKLIRELNFTRPILWISDYIGLDYIGSFDESLICWDSMDEETGFTDNIKEQWRIREKVEYLTQRADIVFTTSKRLYEDKKKLNPHTYLVPNAVDSSYFLTQDKSIPQELREIKKPLLGFIGYLDHWLDIELIKYIANFNREWQIILIGPVRIDISDIAGINNIHIIERRPSEMMPRYIKHFDICLVPFKINKLTDAVNPLKIYEYLALGKPVVATATAEMEHFGNLIYTAGSKEEFVSKITAILNGSGTNSESEAERRREFARKNTWDTRVDEIIRIIQGNLR